MKITPLVAPVAALVMLAACSNAPTSLDSAAPAPALELSTFTGESTTTVAPTTTAAEPTVAAPTSPTCTTLLAAPSTTTASTSGTTSISGTLSTTPQLSASGTYAVAYGGMIVVATCTLAP